MVGASSGLGRGLAEALARRRRRLLLVSSDPRDVVALAADLRIRYHTEVGSLAHDAANHMGLARDLERQLSGSEIEGLLFPLGTIAEGDDGTLQPEEAEQLVRINLLATTSVVGCLLPRLVAQGRGVILGVGSVAAIRGRGRNVIYAATKRALESYFESLRHRLEASGIVVVFYTLGYLDTNLSFGRSLLLRPADPCRVGEKIAAELGRRRGRLYRPWWWRLAALAVRAMPWPVFRRLRF